MPLDPGPSDPYHVLTTPTEAVAGFISALRAVLRALEQDEDVRLEVSESIRNYGFGRCRVTQIVVYWNPSVTDLGRAEIQTYANTLALAFGCELVDLWVEPHHVEEFGPEMVRGLAERAPDYSRLEPAIDRIKKRRSEAAAARL